MYSQAGGIQRIIPAAVARPGDDQQLRQALAWARERGLGVTPRGAGSAMDGSSIGPGLVLDLTGMPADVSIDPGAERAVIRTGTALAHLRQAAAVHRLRFGPDPSSGAWARLTAMMATNAAGPRSHRLGAVDRWVESLNLETGEGPLRLSRGVPPDPEHPVVQRWYGAAEPVLELHRSAVMARWPRTRKNTAGYGLARYWSSGELLDLVIGSEGTLGVITEATLRLEPIPAASATLRVILASRDDLSEAVALLDGFDPTAIELLDASLLEFIATDPDRARALADARDAAALLLVDFEGETADEVAGRADRAAAALSAIGARSRRGRDAAETAAMQQLRHLASPLLAGLTDGRRSLQVIEDGCVPVAALADYLRAVAAACARQQINVVMFGHAGDGHVHVNLLPDLGRPDWRERVRAIRDEVFDKVVALGGTTAGEHGAGRLRADGLGALLGPEAITCFEAVKAAFDPENRFNPGVILSDGSDPFTQLKVGDTAPPLPEGMADRLHRIEVDRRYGQPPAPPIED